ncbi:glycosyltransferase [Allohahella marinimesophila]|uniref:Glycosyltransferase 2-like domain-containing protein n=1 Tax=Allohahella marinimesophila TaxID=1054972 RepID=A0ABP7PXU3_9GAMM
MNRITPSPVISVIIPCRHDASALEACLQSVAAQDMEQAFDIIVVDSNGENSGKKARQESESIRLLVNQYSSARLIKSREPLFAGAARNLGANATEAPGIAFIDADCTADSHWLNSAVAALQTGADGAGGPVGDIAPYDFTAVADNFLQFYDFPARRPAGPLAYMPSCNLAVKRAVFMAMGGFPDVPIGEDVLLTQQIAAQAENALRFEPLMMIRHRGRRTLSTFWAHHRRFGQARGEHALLTHPIEQRLSSSYWYLPVLVLKRGVYMSMRTARWSPLLFLRLLVLSPLVLCGTVSWALGVVEGRRAALTRPTEILSDSETIKVKK